MIMARIHARKRGKSSSKKPSKKGKNVWVKYSSDELKKIIIKLAKEGHPSTMIGLILKDQYGVPDARKIIKKRITDIMKENELYPQLPEDLQDLMKRAIVVRKHLESHRKDKHSRRGLSLIESKIKRLIKYYKRKNILPKDWRYEPEKAKIITR